MPSLNFLILFLAFITHSCSRARLEYIFTCLLPPLKEKTVLDVGSRHGAVLFGAAAFTEAKRIHGIEINEEFVEVSQRAVRKFSLNNRISVDCCELTTAPQIVAEADVVVLNNVFDWFMPKDEQAKVSLRTVRLIDECLMANIFADVAIPPPHSEVRRLHRVRALRRGLDQGRSGG